MFLTRDSKSVFTELMLFPQAKESFFSVLRLCHNVIAKERSD
jgi:hypothetical protein